MKEWAQESLNDLRRPTGQGHAMRENAFIVRKNNKA